MDHTSCGQDENAVNVRETTEPVFNDSINVLAGDKTLSGSILAWCMVPGAQGLTQGEPCRDEGDKEECGAVATVEGSEFNHKKEASSKVAEHIKMYNFLKHAKSVDMVLDTDEFLQKYCPLLGRSTIERRLVFYKGTLVSFQTSVNLFREYLVKYSNHLEDEPKVWFFKKTFPQVERCILDFRAEFFRGMSYRNPIFCNTCRYFTSVSEPQQCINSNILHIINDKIYLVIYDEPFVNGSSSPLKKGLLNESTIVAVLIRDAGEEDFQVDVQCPYILKPWAVLKQMLSSGTEVDIVIYQITGVPIKKFIDEKYNQHSAGQGVYDLQIIQLCRMMIEVCGCLRDMTFFGTIIEDGIFYTVGVHFFQLQVIIIDVPKSGQQSNQLTKFWEHLAILKNWLKCIFLQKGQNKLTDEDELRNFIRLLENHSASWHIDLSSHPYLWSLNMKSIFLMELYKELKNNELSFDFSSHPFTHIWGNWITRNKGQLIPHMMKITHLDGSKLSSLVRFMRHVYIHAHSYGANINHECGCCFQDQDHYFRKCYPGVFIILCKIVVQLRWFHLIPKNN